MQLLIGVFLLALSFCAWAADEQEKVFVYGTYMYCDPSGEDAADKTFEKYFVPAYEAGMAAGDITGWGYMKHHTGGKWRRLLYHMGPSVPAVLKAGDKQGEMLDAKLKPRDNDLAKACRSHDDYIWEVKGGNIGEIRGTVGLSVYMVCDMSKESRVDALVDEVFAPEYDKQVKPGRLASWGWLTHVVGGEYRRLLTMSADNYDDLFAARSELLDTFGGGSAGREFTSICGSHTDYLWDIAQRDRQ